MYLLGPIRVGICELVIVRIRARLRFISWHEACEERIDSQSYGDDLLCVLVVIATGLESVGVQNSKT